jgi:hypothetical protein
MSKIYGTIRNQGYIWRIRTNEKRVLLIKHGDIIKYTKAQRIRNIWHIARMDKERTVKSKTSCNKNNW